MLKSREYVLERLDQWYSDRFRKYYTYEFGAEIAERMNESVKERKDFKFNLEKIIPMVEKRYSREAQIKEAEEYFTQAYSTMEGMAEGMPIEGETIDDIPKGTREEYFDPMFEQFGKLTEFVEYVRKTANEDITKELTDEDINKGFLNTFGGHEGFSEFVESYISIFPYLFDLMVSQGQMSRELADDAVIMLEVGKEQIPYLNETLFGDLKRS